MNNTQKKFLMLVILIAVCIVTNLIVGLTNRNDDEQKITYSDTEEIKANSRKLTVRVYVSGAVTKPGLYDVPSDSRADDAIKIAGGFTELAEIGRVNLARKLKDGMQVNIPTKKLGRVANNKVQNQNTMVNVQETASKKEDVKQALVVNINTASASELQQLPGIGPAMAQRIISAREQLKFTSVEDLLRVKGIGKAKLGHLKGLVRAE